MWIGLDDTDSRRGMCTTFLVRRVLEALPEVNPVRPPRLVRLNPTIPWKTRGNGAVAMEVSDGVSPGEVFARIERVVRAWSDLSDPDTNPGIVVTDRRPPPELYWASVRRIVAREEAEAALEACGATFGGMNGALGIIGAAAAIAWEPGDKTFETIAYREPARWGTRRDVEPESVLAMQRAFPGTFDSYDEENGEVVMVPGSPCPVLFGIRGDDPAELQPAMQAVRSEPATEWTSFETNHGTDDHIVAKATADVTPFGCARVRGRVASPPQNIRGGHVRLQLDDETGAIDCYAFEPTRGFRNIVRALRGGDEVEAFGGVGARRAVNLEKLRVLDPVQERVKIANPRCVECGRAMKSAGRDAGFRCRGCGARASPRDAPMLVRDRSGLAGWHEVPARARRHLAKPLKRLLREKALLPRAPTMARP